MSEKYLGFFIFLGGSCIYSLENSPEIPTMKATLDEVEHEIEITWVQHIAEKDNDMLVFLKVFFNSMFTGTRPAGTTVDGLTTTGASAVEHGVHAAYLHTEHVSMLMLSAGGVVKED